METDALDTAELSDGGGLNRQDGGAGQEGTWLFNPHHYKFDRSAMELDHGLLCRHSGGWSPPERPLVVPFLSARAVGRLMKSPFRGLIRRFAAGDRPWDQPGDRAGGAAPNASGWRGGRTRGVVVVGHGTADAVGAEETRQVAALVAEMLPDVAVELGFLEVIGPSIGEALERLAARGCSEVVAAPLLLFTAGHARRDVPEAVRDGAMRVGLIVRQAEALGCHRDILALTRQRRREALAPLAPCPPENMVLLMIGRGSSDPTAHRQLHDFAVASCENQPPRPADSAGPFRSRIELGFVAAARPTLDEAVANAAGGGGMERAAGVGGPVRRVVVQPHLLFRGHVEEQVTAAVDRGRREHPGIEWVQVQRLGADRLVARALIDRAAVAFPDEVAS